MTFAAAGHRAAAPRGDRPPGRTPARALAAASAGRAGAAPEAPP
jgi:hypothetical protein